MVSAGNEYVGGTRGSCIVSSAADVLGMSVECVKCVCVCEGQSRSEGGEWIRGLD